MLIQSTPIDNQLFKEVSMYNSITKICRTRVRLPYAPLIIITPTGKEIRNNLEERIIILITSSNRISYFV